MHFDAIVLGTGLTESIIAAALSKAGFTVAHVDENAYYGAQEASLSLDELIKWADDRSVSNLEDDLSHYISSQRSKFTSISRSHTRLPHSHQYSLSLSPSIIPAIGPFISSLVSSGVARYGGFRLLEHVGVYNSSGTVTIVPGNKEEIFKSKDISLLDKRRLMRLLLFAAGEFERRIELAGQEQVPFRHFLRHAFALNDDLAGVITYALAFCTSDSDTTLPALHRLRRYLRSAGRYGASCFLLGHYGGAGEIAQGFCRTSAVNGGVYILGKRILSLDQTAGPTSSPDSLPLESHPSNYVITLDDFPDQLSCQTIISSLDYVPSTIRPTVAYVPSSSPSDSQFFDVARCIAIVDRPIFFHHPVVPLSREPCPSRFTTPLPDIPSREVDNSVLIFPPSSLVGGSSIVQVTVLITGEGSLSAPKGKWILYLTMPILNSLDSSPEVLLKPYLNATLSLASQGSTMSGTEPLFTIFYIQRALLAAPPTTATTSTFLVTPSLSQCLPESMDSAAANAEALFWNAISTIKPTSKKLSAEAQNPVESLWPALNDIDENAEDW